MSKVYRYQNLVVQVEDEQIVFFEVRFISDGNLGSTRINIPGPNDPLIKNAGTANIGRGADLKKDQTVVVSDFVNPNVHEEEVSVAYYINGKLLQVHSNRKKEESNPMIILIIKFV